MSNNNENISETDKLRIVLDAVDRYVYDHLREPSTEQEKVNKAVLAQWLLDTAAAVHAAPPAELG